MDFPNYMKFHLCYYKINIDWYAVSPKDICNYVINKKLENKLNEIKLIDSFTNFSQIQGKDLIIICNISFDCLDKLSDVSCFIERKLNDSNLNETILGQLNKLDNVESHFGLFYENGTIKEEIYNVINLSNYTIENNKTKKDKIKNNKIENNKIENNKTENNQNININQSSKEIVSIRLIILLFLVILIHI